MPVDDGFAVFFIGIMVMGLVAVLAALAVALSDFVAAILERRTADQDRASVRQALLAGSAVQTERRRFDRSGYVGGVPGLIGSEPSTCPLCGLSPLLVARRDPVTDRLVCRPCAIANGATS